MIKSSYYTTGYYMMLECRHDDRGILWSVYGEIID